MHLYQIDDQVKTNFTILAIIFSIALAYLFNVLVDFANISIPWWVESPSIFGFYGVILWLYDKHLWKIKFLRSLDWLYIPVIAGTWDVEIKSSHDKFATVKTGRAVIRQTSSKISISIETDQSTSFSVHAALLRVEKLHTYALTYNYTNQPKADSTETMSIHFGTVQMSVSDNCLKMDGQYYTGRDRQNHGSIIFSRLN